MAEDYITAMELGEAGYDVGWALRLPIPAYTDAVGEHHWLRDDLSPWLGEEGDNA